MFLNYYAQKERSSSINLAVGRIILGITALWKMMSYDWNLLQEWPLFLFKNHLHKFYLPFDNYLSYIFILKWLLVISLICFILGHKVALTSFTSAVLIAHITSFHFVVTNHRTLLLVVYLLLFFGIFRETEHLTIDFIRKIGKKSLKELNNYLKSKSVCLYQMDILKWSLVTIALTYFFAGYCKIIYGPLLEWATSNNLSRTIHFAALTHLNGIPPVGQFIINHPSIGFISAWLTIILEVGFLVMVVLKRSISLFIIGIFGMQILIFLAQGLFFFDLIMLYGLFIPWDRLFKKFTSKTKIEVVWDGKCHFCARSLIIFKLLDIRSNIYFYSQSDLPERIGKFKNMDFSNYMYVFKDGKTFEGYKAFRELINHFKIFFLIVFVMKMPYIEKIGSHIYNYVSNQRGNIFRCRI